MNSEYQATVCLDGAAVRRIREEKKLTQLYIAKVVGVTTDTVSRWENNRYPTIKRENALRLTEALEVSLAAIVQQPDPETCEVSAVRRWPRRLLFAFCLLLPIIAVAGHFHFKSAPKAPKAPLAPLAERRLPPHAAPGTVLPVRVWLEAETTKGCILREHFPPGWKLIEANPPASSLDNEEGTARWIIKGGGPRQLVAYLLRLDPQALPGEEGRFRGDIVASPNGSLPASVVGGDEVVRVSPHLWADLNADDRIDDGEMLLASDVFEEMQGVHLDWEMLEAIWDAGGYGWQEGGEHFVPRRPQP